MLHINDDIAIRERELNERFVRSSGPGGQNVNKVSTAVELRFNVSASSLPADVKARLAALAGRRMITGDVLVIDSREHRTQAQNRDAARARLVALVRQAVVRPRQRTATRPGAGSREKRLSEKKRRGQVKGLRGQGERGEE